MTKTIEFVEKEIEQSKEFLDRAIRYNLTICIKNETEKLKILQQIKCELEALELIKKFTSKRSYSYSGKNFVESMYGYFNEQEYEIIKKALEVKDE